MKPVSIAMQAMGIGHSFFYDSQSQSTKELVIQNGRGVANEYGATNEDNSVYSFGKSFGTWYESTNVNYSNISVPTDNGNYNFLTNNCNSWTGLYLK